MKWIYAIFYVIIEGGDVMGDPELRPQHDPKESVHRQLVTRFKDAVGSIDTSKLKRVMTSAAAKQSVAACLIGTMLVGGVIYYYNIRKSGYAVNYNGKFMGYVKDKNVVLVALKDVKEKISEYDPDIKVSDDLKFKRVLVDSSKLTQGSNIEQVMETGLYDQYTAYGITVNGNEMAVVATQDEANQVIQGVKAYFEKQEGSSSIKVLDVTIKDDIEINKEVVDSSKKVDVNDAVNLLTSSKGVTKKYIVKSGETIWQIARDSGMKIQQLASLNPGLDINKLKVGQTIYLSASVPNLNIQTTVQAAFDQNIPYQTSYVNDSSLYRGQSKVVKSGQYGINRVTKKITKLNGNQIASAVISAAIVKNPVTQILAKGTKALIGSGFFAWPVSGHVTSPFGSRGGEFHKGMDICAPYGTSIRAADSGTVVHAGWYYGYGNLIIINHGNGYETYYGHCSSIAVSVGQSVKRGQYIGAVGHTGDADGNHCHFEVRKNGVPQNPARYLR